MFFATQFQNEHRITEEAKTQVLQLIIKGHMAAGLAPPNLG